MIRNLKLLYFLSRRGKLRRQHIPLDENLKDITSAQTFQKQIKMHRQQFESGIPDVTLTQALAQKNPKLGERFKVDRKQLQKNLRKQIKRQLKIQRIIPAAQGEQFQNLQSKSHIYDQKAEIQFEQKFRQQLFRKRQTNRLLQKEKNDYHNYLSEPKSVEFLEYQSNIRKLKNSKIDSMMNFRRNNEQLRLLIDSGYMDNPENLGMILEKMGNSQSPRIQYHYQQGKNLQMGGQMLSESLQEKTNQSQDEIMNKSQNQIKALETNKESNMLAPEIQQLHDKMLRNIQGPQQLRNPKLLQQFFQTLKTSTQIEKQKAQQDLNLMKSIKEFQATTFENRYNALNFRFKGQVDFSWMKESQLLSYIKTQKNITTQPQELLKMYIQNRDKQNKFSQPIITPTVMSRIYSVCSLYDFPQTDENNRINMLNDKKYVDLQRNLFRNLKQLSDQSYADAVFGYAKNHREEQGLLNVRMNAKVMQAIWSEMRERVTSMKEEDLGLVLRSVANTPLLKQQNREWGSLVESLSERLPLMEREYEIESVLSFLTLIPVSERAVEVVSQHIGRMKEYKWQSRQTLECYLQCSAYLIRHKSYFSPTRAHKLIQQLKYQFVSKHEQLLPIIETLSINSMPQLLSILYYFEKSKQAEAKFEIEVPNKLVNKCKKEIVDNVRMQRQLIRKQTVGNVLMSMGMIDYCKQLSKRNDSQQIDLNVLEISTQKSLFCFRPLPFNSINYFTYHELAKLVSNQIPHLPIKSIVQSLFAVSMVRYKNEGIIEDMMSKIVEKIHQQIKDSKLPQNMTHLKYTRDYMLLICCFHHTRMVNPYYHHFMSILTSAPLSVFAKLQPNLLIRFFQTVVTLSFTTNQKYHQHDYTLTKHFCKIFQLTYQQSIRPCLSVLTKYELLVVNYVQHMFAYFQVKVGDPPQKYLQLCKQVNKQLERFVHKFTLQDKYLIQLTKLVHNMTSTLSLTDQNQIQTNTITTPSFSSVESHYYQNYIPIIMDQQQQIGSQYKYQTIYENVRKKLIQQYSSNEVIPKTWRIEIPHKKQVYFITTYQHLFANHEQDGTTVKLFGFWKVYEELYALNKWSFKYVCTFLQG